MFFLVIFIFLLGAGVLGLITWQNLNTLTHLNLYFWKTPEFPVGLLLIGAMLSGALLIYLVAMLSATRERGELRRLRLRVAELEEKQRAFTPLATPLASHLSEQQIVPILPPSNFIKMPGMTGPLPTPPRS